MIRKVLQSGNPVLRKKAREVKSVDKKVKSIIADLKDTLSNQKEPEGVGLAAPQIGKPFRIFVTEYKGFKRVVINPEIIKISQKSKESASLRRKSQKSKSRKEILEGCLSLPYYYGPLKRAEKVTINYLNEKGKKMTETFEGFNAQIILHEVDHLNGILFVDRLLEEKKPLYKVEGDEWEEVELL